METRDEDGLRRRIVALSLGLGMRQRVKFDNPPVIEVVCGVLFGTPRPIAGAEIGMFCQQVEKDFPVLSEQPPISSVIEPADGPTIIEEAALLPMPPLRRTWMISADGRTLLQVQEDRFLFNWKKADPKDDYPSFEAVIQKFEHHLREFRGFLTSRQNGLITYRQYELTYVNHIDEAHGLKKFSMGEVLIDHTRFETDDRFLPEPDAFNWATSYRLADGSGRLHVKAYPAIHQPSGSRLLRLDLTARGMPTDDSEERRTKWFAMAHEWITHGFADSTNKEIQTKIWKRTQ